MNGGYGQLAKIAFVEQTFFSEFFLPLFSSGIEVVSYDSDWPALAKPNLCNVL